MSGLRVVRLTQHPRIIVLPPREKDGAEDEWLQV